MSDREKIKFKVWERGFFEQKIRLFPMGGEYHGIFEACSEDDLTEILKAKGFDPLNCRWERQPKI